MNLDIRWKDFLAELGEGRIGDVAGALALFLGGLLVARLAQRLVRRMVESRGSAQQALLVARGVFYSVVVLALFLALQMAGVEIGVLLGAAGILTVALGFAAQTSASNLISGLFLMAERPFVLGDAIRVGETVGMVEDIDLLSVKLRTYDNLLVRIPNESLLRSEITNLTRHPIRRLDIPLGIAYGEDPERAQKVLEAVADANELSLDEPEPLFFVLGFGDSAINLRFSVWSSTERFFELRTRILVEIKHAFDAEGIEFPFPQRTLTFDDPLRVENEESDLQNDSSE